MDVQLIACNKIEFAKTNKEVRTFSKEFAVKLADSLQCEGMYNPICVRPDPARPGSYLGVQGKHRFYATKVVLKEPLIACNVIADMDDAEAEMARIAENLWRNPLTKAQHALCVQKWWAHFQARNPERAVKGKVGSLAAAEARRAKKEEAGRGAGAAAAEEAAVGVGAGAIAAGSEASTAASFAEQVAAATGQSVSSAYRTQRITQAFDAGQLKAFDRAGATQADMLTIAKIKDEAQRGAVVNLIASGLKPAEAIAAVLGDAAPVRDNGASKAENAAKVSAKAEEVAELSDDEWFDRYCGEKANMLGDSARFKADALLYRRLVELRHNFRVKAKRAVADTREAGVRGAFWYLVNRFISLSHPRDWWICGECKATGEDAQGGKCRECSGGGYLLKTEEYL